VYQQFCKALKTRVENIAGIQQIPFLPISFFKTHNVITTAFVPEVTFESSGTSQMVKSRHRVKTLEIYEKSFGTAFRMFYGDPLEWCIIALLPSYLERKNSSLVLMAEKLIQESNHEQSGFYLNEYKKLNTTLQSLEEQKQKTEMAGTANHPCHS